MNRAAFILVGLVVLVGLLWFFPLFHVVPLKQASEQRATATFDPSRFVERFWSEKLLKSLDQAVPVDVLLPLIRSDPLAAKKQYSRSLGLGDSYTYFVRGTGRVVAVSDQEVSLAISGQAPQVSLRVGLLFGNAVRDGTGLINVSDYPNSQDFNAISKELNQFIEARILPPLRQKAKVGMQVRFVGCAEINDPSHDLSPLVVVPIEAEVQ